MISIYYSPFSGKYAEQHELGIKLLERAVYDIFGIKITENDIKKTERGKPYFEKIPVNFSISHTKGCVVCGVISGENGSIGVDCEYSRSYNERTARRVFSENELEIIRRSEDADRIYTRLWTCKESYVKYTGTGLAGHTGDVDINISGENTACGSGVYFYSRQEDGIIITVCSRLSPDENNYAFNNIGPI